MNLVGQLSVKLIMTLLVGKDLFPKLRKLVELGRLKWRVSGAGKTGLEARCQEMMKHWMVVRFFFKTEAEKFLFHFMLLSSEI